MGNLRHGSIGRNDWWHDRGVLGFLLCSLLFGHRLTNRIFYTVAASAAIVGILSAIVFRLLTNGEGAWLAACPTMIATILASVWLRIWSKSS
jgi:hypothetical protein